MEEITSLSEFEYGALKEIGNIGIGKSAVSLSRLKTVLYVPEFSIQGSD